MEILAIRPESGGGKTLAFFDAQLSPHIRMFEIRLVDGPRGLRAFPPGNRRHAFATLAPEFAHQLAAAAMAALNDGEARQDDRSN